MSLDLLTPGQAGKEYTVNELAKAFATSAIFARRQTTSTGLTWGYYGGYLLLDGVLTSVADGTIALTASATNYIETTRAGVVSKNTTGFTAGSIPLYTATTDGSGVTASTDYRVWATFTGVAQRAAIVMASDANVVLTRAQAVCDILSVTSSVSLTATRNVQVPLAPQQWTVFNGTTGAQSLQFIGATGTGITVANGKRAILYSDGTNVVRVTADT